MMNRELALHEFLQACKYCNYFLNNPKCDRCKFKVAIHDIRSAIEESKSGHCSTCEHMEKYKNLDCSFCTLHMKEFDCVNGSCEYWEDKKYWAKKRKKK